MRALRKPTLLMQLDQDYQHAGRTLQFWAVAEWTRKARQVALAARRASTERGTTRKLVWLIDRAAKAPGQAGEFVLALVDPDSAKVEAELERVPIREARHAAE